MSHEVRFIRRTDNRECQHADRFGIVGNGIEQYWGSLLISMRMELWHWKYILFRILFFTSHN